MADIINFLPDLTFAINKEGKVIAWNRAAEEITGVKAEDMIGKGNYEYAIPFYTVRHPLLIDAVLHPELKIEKGYDYLKRIDDSVVAEGFVPHLGHGKGLYLWGTATPLYDAHGNIVGAIETLRDISERKKAEAALLDSERRLADIINFLPDATFAIDNQGKVIAWNRAMEEMTGVKSEAMLGKGNDEYAIPFYGERRSMLADLVLHPDEQSEKHYDVIEKAKGAYFVEIYIPSFKGGAYFWAKANPLFDSHGKIVGAIETIRDITETKRAQEERTRLQQGQIEALKQADILKDQFLSILSHELRTPINVISGFGSILDDEVAGPLTEQQHDYLKKMLKGAENLLVLVNDLLDMSRIQAGRFTILPSPMNFSSVANSAIENLRPLAEQKHQALLNEIPSNLPDLMADEMRIGQVLINLINNAIKFTPEGGKIWVKACVEGNSLRCEVSDTGIGISPENIPKLFSRFTQLDMTLTRKAGGTGLGLSISKAIIDAHHGQIGVESELGKGSTFWFTLPLSVPKQA